MLETVDKYKYLGIIMHEKAGRALGSLINKIHNLKDFGFRAYEILSNSCVALY
jgi:hypothetical protein